MSIVPTKTYKQLQSLYIVYVDLPPKLQISFPKDLSQNNNARPTHRETALYTTLLVRH
jgi:hypothetical protein